MPLSSMLSKVSKEIGNYKMDSDGNIVKKKKDTYQEQSYGGGGGGGGSYGYSNGHASSNGYSNGGYSNDGGYDSRYGAPQYEQNHYAPPPGPPQGHHGGHSNYGPPGGAPQGRSRLPFQPKMEMWSEISSDADTYFYLGERSGNTVFSAKMPTLTGRLVVNAGGRKSSDTLGEARDTGIKRSSSKISLPNGFTCDLQKSGFKQIGETSYTFTVPTDGGKQETFMWKLDDQGFKSMMKGQPAGWSLIRAEDNIKVDPKNPEPAREIKPLAKFIDDEGMGLSSKMKVGHLEFVGEGVTGNLGRTWAAVAVIAIVKAKAKQAEKTIIQEVTGTI